MTTDYKFKNFKARGNKILHCETDDSEVDTFLVEKGLIKKKIMGIF